MADANTQRALHSIADLLLTGPARPDSASADVGSYPFPGVTRRSSREPAQGPERRRQRLEAVFVAQVPGYAAPWLTQYARLRARQEQGPVAVARVRGRQLDLEMIDPEAGPGTDSLDESLLASARSMRARVIPADELLGSALREMAGECRAVLLMRLGSLDTEAVRGASELEQWTVLTSCEDQAIVACYQLLKTLFQSPRVLGPAHGVRIIFVGCDEPRAQLAFTRLGNAAGKFLEVPIELAGVLRRLEPVRGRVLGSFECETDAWSAVAEAWLSADPSARRVPGSETPLLSQEEINALTADLGDSSPPIAAAPQPPQGRSAARPEVIVPQTPRAASAPRPPQRVPPRPADSTAPVPPAAVTLASHLAGFNAIAARAPRHPDIELATDPAGRLHLLLRITGAQSADTAVRSLIEARLWATEHRAILAMACPTTKLDPALEPTMHLFTDRPKSAAALAFAGLPEAPVLRLHLLKSVTVAGQSIDVHEEIN